LKGVSSKAHLNCIYCSLKRNTCFRFTWSVKRLSLKINWISFILIDNVKRLAFEKVPDVFRKWAAFQQHSFSRSPPTPLLYLVPQEYGWVWVFSSQTHSRCPEMSLRICFSNSKCKDIRKMESSMLTRNCFSLSDNSKKWGFASFLLTVCFVGGSGVSIGATTGKLTVLGFAFKVLNFNFRPKWFTSVTTDMVAVGSSLSLILSLWEDLLLLRDELKIFKKYFNEAQTLNQVEVITFG